MDITLPDTIIFGCAKIDIAPIIKKRDPKLILCNCLLTMNKMCIRDSEVMVGKLQSIFQEKDYQNRDLVEDVVIELKQAYNTVNICLLYTSDRWHMGWYA